MYTDDQTNAMNSLASATGSQTNTPATVANSVATFVEHPVKTLDNFGKEAEGWAQTVGGVATGNKGSEETGVKNFEAANTAQKANSKNAVKDLKNDIAHPQNAVNKIAGAVTGLPASSFDSSNKNAAKFYQDGLDGKLPGGSPMQSLTKSEAKISPKKVDITSALKKAGAK